jgi:putative ABC transport system permease protein
VVLSHGDGAFDANDHRDQPFTVTGILARTGTPVDRTVHIALAGMDAIHAGQVGGVRIPGLDAGALSGLAPAGPQNITAMLVGLQNRAAVFAMQRDVAAFPDEPLMAILPGATLDELWQVVGTGESALQVMSALVAAVSLAGLVAVILAGLEQRRRELAILRAVGAGPRHMLQLLAAEGLLITLAGTVLGVLLHAAAIVALGGWLRSRFGLDLSLTLPGARELGLLAALVGAGLLASLVPGWRAYRLSLADGLSPRT